MHKLTFLFIAIALSGCAQRQWVKNGAPLEEGGMDDAACLQVARQNSSENTSLDPNKTNDKKTIVTNWNLWEDCIAARGYRYKMD